MLWPKKVINYMDNSITGKELYNEWINIADSDYEISKRMLDEHWPKQFINICYHSQQAAEKYLKGYLVYNNESIKLLRTHDLVELLNLCTKYDNDFDTLKSIGSSLSPYATQIRYPSNAFDVTEVEAKQALNYAKEIIDFVSSKVE